MSISKLISKARIKGKIKFKTAAGGACIQFTWLHFNQGQNEDDSGGNPIVLPGIPQNLIATPGDSQVALAWDVDPLATTYNVKRSLVPGGPYTTIASPAINNYTDLAVSNGTTYYYVVSSVNGAGQSGNSSEVSAQPVTYVNTLVYIQTDSTVSIIPNPTGSIDLTGISPEITEVHCHDAPNLTNFTIIGDSSLALIDFVNLVNLAGLTIANCPSLTGLDLTGFASIDELSLTGNGLTSLTTPDLAAVTTDLELSNNQFTSLSFPSLTSSLRVIAAANSALVTIDLSALVTCQEINLQNNVLLESISLPALTGSLSTFNAGGCLVLEDLLFPSLVSTGNISAGGCPLLVNLNFGVLESFASIDLNGSAITAIDFPANLGPLGAIDLSSCTQLVSVTAAGPPELTNFLTYDLEGCSLDETTVDNVLAWGVTGGVTGCLIDLSGGTNSPPSVSGMTDYGTLVAAGNTVLINPPATDNAEDSMQSYSAGNDLNGLNGGSSWADGYVSRSAPRPEDSFQSYTPSADLDGLNGGSEWAGPYVSR
jgi:hypothetical protein